MDLRELMEAFFWIGSPVMLTVGWFTFFLARFLGPYDPYLGVLPITLGIMTLAISVFSIWLAYTTMEKVWVWAMASLSTLTIIAGVVSLLTDMF